MPRKPTPTPTNRSFMGGQERNPFNKLKQMSTKPSVSASTVEVPVKCFLPLLHPF